MTILEIEQAILINPNTDRQPEINLTELSRLNFVKMCGPIVEIVDEELRFVHFTVQEYVAND